MLLVILMLLYIKEATGKCEQFMEGQNFSSQSSSTIQDLQYIETKVIYYLSNQQKA